MNSVNLSPQFKKYTSRSIWSIILFVFSYLILFIISIQLLILTGWIAYKLILSHPSIATIFISLALLSFAGFIMFFMVKFLFKSNKIDRSRLIEITRGDQPQLFEIIDDIVVKVGTKSPKRVYLSEEVNARVFYDSNILSMLFPIKKNLEIGLGLMNGVTQTELKSILAHEFGHFSQKEMKVGSYVYNVNHIIHNLLYENDDFDRKLVRWGESNAYFALAIAASIFAIRQVQYILKEVYAILNNNYMALSREMEFHADEIAAQVTGHAPLQESLLRLDFINNALVNVQQFYQYKSDFNTISDNIYEKHRIAIEVLSTKEKLPKIHNLPNIKLSDLDKYKISKITIEDQWASHPTIEQRYNKLTELNIATKESMHQLAVNILENKESIEKKMTELWYRDAPEIHSPHIQTNNEFTKEWQADFEKNSSPKVYNGYYDNHKVSPIDISQPVTKSYSTEDHICTHYSDKCVKTTLQVAGLTQDIQILEQLESVNSDIKTFDYDGIKKYRSDIPELKKQLTDELRSKEKELWMNDQDIYDKLTSYEQSINSTGLRALYHSYISYKTETQAQQKLYKDLTTATQFLFEGGIIDEVQEKFQELSNLEVFLKEEIKEMLKNNEYNDQIMPSIRADLEKYVSRTWQYFDTQIRTDAVQRMLLSINAFGQIITEEEQLREKKLLTYQSEVIDTILTTPQEHSEMPDDDHPSMTS